MSRGPDSDRIQVSSFQIWSHEPQKRSRLGHKLWVVNEWAMVVTANIIITWKTVQLVPVRWSSRKEWVVQACQSAWALDSALDESCIRLVRTVQILPHANKPCSQTLHELRVMCRAGLTVTKPLFYTKRHKIGVKVGEAEGASTNTDRAG